MTVHVVYSVFQGIDTFLQIYSYLLWGYCILSWFAKPYNKLYIFLQRITEPALAPFRPIARKLIERGIMIDISVILAFVAMNFIRSLMWRLFYMVV